MIVVDQEGMGGFHKTLVKGSFTNIPPNLKIVSTYDASLTNDFLNKAFELVEILGANSTPPAYLVEKSCLPRLLSVERSSTSVPKGPPFQNADFRPRGEMNNGRRFHE
jgi:hypothetical protein